MKIDTREGLDLWQTCCDDWIPPTPIPMSKYMLKDLTVIVFADAPMGGD